MATATLDDLKNILEQIALQGAGGGGGGQSLTPEEQQEAVDGAQRRKDLAEQEYEVYNKMSFIRKGIFADEEKSKLLREAEVELQKAEINLLEKKSKHTANAQAHVAARSKMQLKQAKDEEAADKKRRKSEDRQKSAQKDAYAKGKKFAGQYTQIVAKSLSLGMNQSAIGKSIASAGRSLMGMVGSMASLVVSAISFGAALVAAGVALTPVLLILGAMMLLLAPLIAIGVLIGGLIAFTAWAVQSAVEARDLAASFTRLTGATFDYGKEIIELRGELAELGIGAKELTAAYGALYKQTTIFTQSTEIQRRNMGATVAMLEKWGVSADTTAKIMQTMVTSLGVSVEVVGDEMAALKSHAQLLQVDIAAYVQDFAAMGGELAVYDDAVGTFKSLAAAQKITGMEMRKIIDLSRKFDTFEGAAKMAGNLNAALGGNFVNAMDMMTETDPVKRFQMIRDALKDGGAEFETMGYYAKRFYMEQLGLKDVSELAVLMRGDLNDLSGDYGKSADELLKLRRQTQQYQSTLDIFKGFLAKMQPVLAALVDPIQDWIDTLTDPSGGATEAFTKLQSTMTKTVTQGILPVLEKLPDATARAIEGFDKFTTWIDNNEALISRLASVMEKLLILMAEFGTEAIPAIGEDVMQISGWSSFWGGDFEGAAKDFDAADSMKNRGTYWEETQKNLTAVGIGGLQSDHAAQAGAVWDQMTLSMRRMTQAANEKHSLSFNESLQYYEDVFDTLPADISKTARSMDALNGKFGTISADNTNLGDLMVNSSTAGMSAPPPQQKTPQSSQPLVKQPVEVVLRTEEGVLAKHVINVIGREIQAVIA